MASNVNRRGFFKGTILSAASIKLALDSRAQSPPNAALPSAVTKASLPAGKIGKLEISRIILGGNLLTHYTHSRDLKYVYGLAAHYNTDEKIQETLALAEAHGINTVSMHNPPHPISLLKRYRRERGGKIKWIICPTAPVESDMSKYRQEIEELVTAGAEAIYLWGVHSDALVVRERIDLIAKAVEVAKEFGVPSGVGAHSLEVVKASEKYGVNADFYIKTFHHHNYPTGPKPDQLKAPYSEFPGYWCRDPQETADFMRTVTKPWIAFKVMAAGAIPPTDAFHYAFLNGADFVLAGMLDFEIAEDVRIAKEVLANVTTRARTWHG